MRKKSVVTWEVIYYQPQLAGGIWKRCNPIYRNYDAAFTFVEWLHRAGFTALALPTHELDMVGLPEGPPPTQP